MTKFDVPCAKCGKKEEVKANTILGAINKLGDKGWKLNRGTVICVPCKDD